MNNEKTVQSTSNAKMHEIDQTQNILEVYPENSPDYRFSKEFSTAGDCHGNSKRLMERMVRNGIDPSRLQMIMVWSMNIREKVFEALHPKQDLKIETEKKITDYKYHIFVLVDGKRVYDLSAVGLLWGTPLEEYLDSFFEYEVKEKKAIESNTETPLCMNSVAYEDRDHINFNIMNHTLLSEFLKPKLR